MKRFSGPVTEAGVDILSIIEEKMVPGGLSNPRRRYRRIVYEVLRRCCGETDELTHGAIAARARSGLTMCQKCIKNRRKPPPPPPAYADYHLTKLVGKSGAAYKNQTIWRRLS